MFSLSREIYGFSDEITRKKLLTLTSTFRFEISSHLKWEES